MKTLKPLTEKIKELNANALSDIYAGLAVALIVSIVTVLSRFGWIGVLATVGLIALLLVLFVLRYQPKRAVRLEEGGATTGNLPARGRLVGRKDEIKRLFEGLNSSYPIIYVVGEAGIGKTSLAREIGWLVKDGGSRFRYVVWLEDHDGDLTGDELYQTIIAIWGETRLKELNPAELRIELMRLLQEKPTLIIIDNYDTVVDRSVIEFARRVPAPASKTIVTSRKMEDWQDGWVVKIGDLPAGDCKIIAQMETERSGENLPSLDSPIFREIIEFSGGSPYRLRALMGRLMLGAPLSDADRRGAIELLEPWWTALRDDPAAKKTIMGICLFQAQPSAPELMKATGLNAEEIASGAERLSKTLMIEVRHDAHDMQARYAAHARTRSFVLEKILGADEFSRELLERTSVLIEEYVEENGGVRNWNGYKRLNDYFQTIRIIFKWADGVPDPVNKRRVVKIWRMIDHFLSVRANLDEYIELGGFVLQCARDLGDESAATAVKVELLGWAYLTKARRANLPNIERENLLASAEALILEGLAFYQADGDVHGAGVSYKYLGSLAKLRGDYTKAGDYWKQSLQNFESGKGLYDFGTILSEMGDAAYRQGDHKKAIEIHKRRLIFAEALNDPEGISVAMYNLGNVLKDMGRGFEAERHYEKALKFAADASRFDIVGASQYQLGAAWRKRWEIVRADEMTRRAIVTFENNTGIVSRELLDLSAELEVLMRAWKTPHGRVKIWIRKLLATPVLKKR